MIKKALYFFSFFISFLLVNITAIAESGVPETAIFDVDNIKTKFSASNEGIQKNNLTLTELTRHVDNLELIYDEGKECVNKTKEQLNKLHDLLTSKELESSLELEQADYKYLKDKELVYAKQLAECRLFIYQAQDILSGHKEKIKKLSTHKILQRDKPVWEINATTFVNAYQQFDFKKLYSAGKVEQPTLKKLALSLILLIAAFFIALSIHQACRRWLAKDFVIRFLPPAFIAATAVFIFPLILFVTTEIFLFIWFGMQGNINGIKDINHLLLWSTTVWAISTGFLKPPFAVPNLLRLSPDFSRLLYSRWMILFILAIFGVLLSILFQNQVMNLKALPILKTIFIIAFSASMLWFLLGFFKHPKIEKFHHPLSVMIKILLFGLFVVIVASEVMGFYQLTLFLLTNIIITACIILGAVIAWWLIDFIHQRLDNKKYVLAQKAHYLLGVKLNRELTELYFIKFVLYAVVIFVVFLLLLMTWEVSANVIDTLEEGFFDGVLISGLSVNPSRIVIGVISFSCLLMLGRLLATRIARRNQFEGEEDTQVAVASIVMYVTFSLGLLFALLIMGVNFTGLAIIAGGLSVGIGLGLQNIAENFVSGFFLLFDKTLKPGDRVIVGNTEGFIKKIRLRSTQITTLAKEDVIVPNAAFITSQVTNFMFKNRHWRLACQVGVAYGSDIQLVKETLLKVASENTDVVQEGKTRPTVLFRSFGESSLQFELWCLIYDVNKKYIVISDLNFAIDAAFRENKITIAFPQRDIHIHQN
jgi:potassium-dependent mechanosensitive channel